LTLVQASIVPNNVPCLRAPILYVQIPSRISQLSTAEHLDRSGIIEYLGHQAYLSFEMATETMTSPNLLQSPYRLPPIPKSASGNDLVSGIVDKFNSLTVVDKDEQRDYYEKQILKLRSALDRAQVAREEAETEARKLREKLLDLQDERQKEKTALRERAQEFEVSRSILIRNTMSWILTTLRKSTKRPRTASRCSAPNMPKKRTRPRKNIWRTTSGSGERLLWHKRRRNGSDKYG